MAEKYTIEVTKKQAGALQLACEVGARIGMYQLHDVCNLLPWKTPGQREIYDEIYEKLWAMYLKYTNKCMDDRKRPDVSNTLWDLYQVIRHRLSWDAHPEGDNMSVMFDPPMRTGEEELPKIKAVE